MSAPITKVDVGQIHAAIWENQGKEGKTFNTVTLNKSYKEGEEWKNTNTLSASDLPKAILALQKAYEHIALKEKS